jgi:hypothetical protein
MKILIRFLTSGLTVAALCPVPIRAADPQTPRTKGHVLVLENERTVEGDIERDGDQYRIRRQGGETWVPAATALRLCETLQEAYQFLQQRANLRDPDERLRLGRWCQLHGLRAQAVAEAEAALELRPTSAEAQHLLQSLQRAANTPAAAAAPSPAVVKASAPAVPPAVDINAEAMGAFISRVQPILMNACASCHVSGQAGSFQLVRALAGGLVNRHATQQNLQAVLAQVNREHWEGSPLLTKAVAVHGRASQPPLKNRQAPPYRNLEDWVRANLARNPVAPEQALVARAPPLAEPNRLPDAVMAKAVELGGDAVSSTPPPAAAPASVTPTAVEQPEAAHQPRAPMDPFDPAIFNQQMHPRRAKK